MYGAMPLLSHIYSRWDVLHINCDCGFILYFLSHAAMLRHTTVNRHSHLLMLW